MKTDARVRYTKKVIIDALVTLLKDKSINKITVTEICQRAEINRATFYKHYKDPYDLYEQLQEQIYVEYKAMIDSFDEDGVEETFRKMLQMIKDVQDSYGAILQQPGEERLLHRLSEYSFEHFSETIVNMRKDTLTKEEGEMCYCYLSGGTASVIDYWINGGAVLPVEDIVQQIMSLNHIITRGIGKGEK